jgi:hypothetical protein
VQGARTLVLAASLSGAIACSSEPVQRAGGTKTAAHVLALSAYSSAISVPIDAFGSGYPEALDAAIELHFNGTFTDKSGASSPVDLLVDTHRIDSGTVRWTSFGPYGNPFGASPSSIGGFEGTVGARIVEPDGTTIDDPDPTSIHFDVLPSIVVHELEPITAQCAGSIERAIGGAAYRLRVEAAGFDPASFTYSLSQPFASTPDSVRHIATGPFDVIGDKGDFTLPDVPPDQESYSAVFTIQARDKTGADHESAFAVQVHRPLEIFYNGNVQVAELLEPVPVSGCIPGGQTGRTVEYNESMDETRTRSYELNWNESWLSSHTVSNGSMNMIGTSETNGVGFSTTDGTNWNWSLGSQVSGNFSIGKLVELGVQVNGSVGGGGMMSNESSSSRQKGIDQSTTTTETTESSMQQGGQQGGAFTWMVSSSQTISHQFGGDVIAGTYGVFYRQTLRLLRRAAVVTYNQCGAATVVADLDFQDWTWSPDLALGNQCPPFPESNLPKAQCVISPCSGQ